jgi:hypothetical protein
MRVEMVVVMVLTLMARSVCAFAVGPKCAGRRKLACAAADLGDDEDRAAWRAERAKEAETDAHLMSGSSSELNIEDTLAKMMVGENKDDDGYSDTGSSICDLDSSRSTRVNTFKAIYTKIKAASSGEGTSVADVDGQPGPSHNDAAAMLKALFPEKMVLRLTPRLTDTDTHILTLTSSSPSGPIRFPRRSTSGK